MMSPDLLSDSSCPFPDTDQLLQVFYTKNDQEYWKYSYPLHTKNTVPAWSVPVIATGGPLLVFAFAALFSKPARLELHNVILGLITAVLVTSTVTNLVKLGVSQTFK